MGAYVFLTSNASGRANEGRAGNTGAPGDEKIGSNPSYCTSCHSGGASASSVQVSVTDGSGNVVTSYTPDATYKVKVTVVDEAKAYSRYGFQMISIKDSNSSPYNAWSNPATNVRTTTLTGPRIYAEHKNPSVTNTFEVDWKAPAAGFGAVTFYVSGNAVNNNNNTTGDRPSNTTLHMTEHTVSTSDEAANAISVYPNPASSNLIIANMEDAANAKIEVYNIAGKLMVQKSAADLINNSMDISGFNSGVYLVKIKNNRIEKTMRFVKE